MTSRLLVTAAAVLIAAVPIFSQTGNAIVKGSVTDPSGSVIPQAKVSLTNTGTNVVRTTAVSAEGLYYLGDVQPGSYALTIESPGFKRWTGTFTVQVGQ